MRPLRSVPPIGVPWVASLAAAWCLLAPPPGPAQVITFTRIADTSTPIPGGAGTFTNLITPSMDNGHVAFYGSGSSGSGVYTNLTGSLTAFVNTATPIPGGTGNFTGFLHPVLSGGRVGFVGFGGSGQQGVYTDAGGTLAAVASTSTSIPGGSGNFTSFGNYP